MSVCRSNASTAQVLARSDTCSCRCHSALPRCPETPPRAVCKLTAHSLTDISVCEETLSERARFMFSARRPRQRLLVSSPNRGRALLPGDAHSVAPLTFGWPLDSHCHLHRFVFRDANLWRHKSEPHLRLTHGWARLTDVTHSSNMEHVDKVPQLLWTRARKDSFCDLDVVAVLNDLVRHAVTRVSDDTCEMACFRIEPSQLCLSPLVAF